MIKESPRSRFNRRAFAPISITVEEAESSIHSGASAKFVSAPVTFPQSSRFMCPVRNLCASTRASDASKRSSSDSFDISRLKIATGSRCRTATFSAMFSASAVFPHRGPPPKNNHPRRRQPRRFVIEVRVTSSETGDPSPLAEYFFQPFEIVANQFLNANQPGLHAVFRQLENHRLRAVQNHIRIVAG